MPPLGLEPLVPKTFPSPRVCIWYDTDNGLPIVGEKRQRS